MSVEKYSFQIELDGHWHCVELPARSFEEAETAMFMLNGRNLGKIEEQHPVCNECFGELICFQCEDLADGFLPPDTARYQN